MKFISFLIICVITLQSCKNNTQQSTKPDTKVSQTNIQTFGKKITANNAIKPNALTPQLKTIKNGDSVATKISAKVNSVCQAKGCWMRLDLENGNNLMVKFKDYAFFVPKDITGKDVIVNGKAYVEEMSVNEQRHYAEDAGKSEEEIAKITAPKRTYLFEADGVLLLN